MSSRPASFQEQLTTLVDQIRTPRRDGVEAIRRFHQAGTVQRVTRGAYIDSDHGESWAAQELRMLARCLAISEATDDAVFSHSTAAYLRGLMPTEFVVHVTQPWRRNSRRRSGVRYHFRNAVDEADPVLMFPRVATTARIVVDVALDFAPSHAIKIVDSAARSVVAVARGQERHMEKDFAAVKAQWLRALEDRGSVPNCRRARGVISLASPCAESAQESVLRLHLAAAGFRVVPQYAVRTPEATFWVDLAIVDSFGLPVLMCEYDGESKYQDPSDVLAEKKREHLLQRWGGAPVLRVMREDLLEPRSFVAHVESLVPTRVLKKTEPMLEFARYWARGKSL